MSNSNNHLEEIASELYKVVRDLKVQSFDTYTVEAANRAMKRYESFKFSKEDKSTPLFPGYEQYCGIQEEPTLFSYAS